MEYIPSMEWVVDFHPKCSSWFESLEASLRDEILANLLVLQKFGPSLGRPRVDSIKGSKYSNLKELRVQYKGQPVRILFAFDPSRHAILLDGGTKQGDDRWYDKHISIAEARYTEHLQQLKKRPKK
jgi:hypothetical protein